MNDTDEIYYYNEQSGIYAHGEVLIKAKAEEYEKDITSWKVNKIINKIKRRTYVARSEFDKNLDVLNLKNGFA